MFIPGVGFLDTGVTAVRNKINDSRAKRAVDALVNPSHTSGATDTSVTSDIDSMKKIMDGYDITTRRGKTEHVDGFNDRYKKIEESADKRGRLHIKPKNK
jgi:hypothetical protein